MNVLQRFHDLLESVADQTREWREQFPAEYPDDQSAALAIISNLMDDHHDGGWVAGIVSVDFLAALLTEVEAGQPVDPDLIAIDGDRHPRD